ncbi:MAG: universal stress protein [Nitrospiraceae bacterium]|nr:MAG: universal stress protein [Nitrospiraceae bacterium]
MGEAQVCPIGGLSVILFATDGSAHSENAMTEAVNLSKACSTKLFAVSIVEGNPEYDALAPGLVEKKEKEAKEFLDATKNCAEREGITCNIIARHAEDAADAIVEEAEKLKSDMIIMGRHGRKKGIKKLLMGSVTSKVIGYAPCKVLVVP